MSSTPWTAGKTSLSIEVIYQILDELLPKTIMRNEKAVLLFNPQDYPLTLSMQALHHFHSNAKFVLLQGNNQDFLDQVIAYGIPIKRVENPIPNAVLTIGVQRELNTHAFRIERQVEKQWFAVMEAKHLKTFVALVNGHHWPRAYGKEVEAISSISIHFSTDKNPQILSSLVENVQGIRGIPSPTTLIKFSIDGTLTAGQIYEIEKSVNHHPWSQQRAFIEASEMRERGNWHLGKKNFADAVRHFAIAAHVFGAHIKSFQLGRHLGDQMFLVELWASAMEAYFGMRNLTHTTHLAVQVDYAFLHLSQLASMEIISRIVKVISVANHPFAGSDVNGGYRTATRIIARELHNAEVEERRLLDQVSKEEDIVLKVPIQMSQASNSERKLLLRSLSMETVSIYQESLQQRAVESMKTNPLYGFFTLIQPLHCEAPCFEEILIEGKKNIKALIPTFTQTMFKDCSPHEVYRLKEMLESDVSRSRKAEHPLFTRFKAEYLEIFWTSIPKYAQACIDMFSGTSELKGYFNARNILAFALKKDPQNQELLAMMEDCLTGFKAKAKKNKEDEEQNKLAGKIESMGLNKNSKE